MKFTISFLLVAICVMAMSEASATTVARVAREANPELTRNPREADPGNDRPTYLPRPTFRPVRVAREADPAYERPPYLPRPTPRPYARVVREANPAYERPPYLPRPTPRPYARVVREADPGHERPPYLPRPTFRPFRVVREASPENVPMIEDVYQY
ncbi:apidaecins type 22-like isoform X2 [Drosophila innubila]|uniref:apidaecins type 22-like isoform X2 n=1 Tax=Drosophila innubila TaxID=198719 RepID=UPI00148D7D22|nr:apidaecins type 22-like isoform X2 [Drosophila innubila]